MAYQDLIYETDGRVAIITLNRPDRMNALSPNLHEELHRAFDEADADNAIGAIVLTGAGKAFCAGFDQEPNKTGRKNSDPHGKSIAEFIKYCHGRQSRRIRDWQHMWRLGKPIIAAVNGWAMGAGFWYQLAADLTLASDQAVFAQPEVRHISSSSYLMTALCGWKAANRWALTGDHFDAAEAYRIGMVNEVVPHEELLERAKVLAARIAKVPEPSVRLNKAIAMQGIQAGGLHAALISEQLLSTMAQASHNEFREQLFETQRTQGTRAYLQMRDGPFQPEPMGPRSKKRGS